MKIDSVQIDNFTVFAPLAGISNLPMRLLVKSSGCGLVYSEMISANGLIHNSLKTFKLLDSNKQEKPISAQIFGSDPNILANAAQIIESSGIDIVDINFGCSVKKILKTGSGSALMKDPKKAELILKKVKKSLKIPLTIKIRSGWDQSGSQAIHIAKIAEDCGVDAIAIHPRTATQGFKGVSNWSIIKSVKKNTNIPIIGNGDINTPYDAIKMKQDTGCDYVMIGRSAIGNPMIFKQILELNDGIMPRKALDQERIDTMKKYLEISVNYLGEKIACKMMRSRLSWFVKGMKNATKFRNSIKFISSAKEAISLISEYKKTICR